MLRLLFMDTSADAADKNTPPPPPLPPPSVAMKSNYAYFEYNATRDF